MANLLNDLLSRAKDVTDAAGKKTDEYYQLSKLKLRSVQLHADIRNRHEMLGLRVYDMFQSGIEDTDELVSLIAELQTLRERLEENEQRIMEVSGYITCPVCGEKNKIKALYCSGCGYKFVTTDEAVEENENQTPIFSIE